MHNLSIIAILIIMIVTTKAFVDLISQKEGFIMSDMNALVPAVANAVVAVSGNITNLITKAKAYGVIQHAQFEMLRTQTAKVLADARAYHSAEIITTNLEQIARTQELIDSLEKQGKLHGRSLAMAMEQLGDLNDILRRNLRRFENREWR